MSVRAAKPADLPGVAAIYDEQVLTSVATFDLEPRPLDGWQDRLASVQPGDHFLVAVDGSEVTGFAYSSAYRAKPAYALTREVTVYVAASARGQRVGRRLYEVLLAAMRADGIHLAVAVIARPNAASERLHAAFGFTEVGVLPEVGWKQDRWVDTAFWALMLSPAGEAPPVAVRSVSARTRSDGAAEPQVVEE